MQILKGLSLDIEPGQRVAIVGPSGNGKSTILQLIQQLYSPTSGQVIQNLDCSQSSYQGHKPSQPLSDYVMFFISCVRLQLMGLKYRG